LNFSSEFLQYGIGQPEFHKIPYSGPEQGNKPLLVSHHRRLTKLILQYRAALSKRKFEFYKLFSKFPRRPHSCKLGKLKVSGTVFLEEKFNTPVLAIKEVFPPPVIYVSKALLNLGAGTYYIYPPNKSKEINPPKIKQITRQLLQENVKKCEKPPIPPLCPESRLAAKQKREAFRGRGKKVAQTLASSRLLTEYTRPICSHSCPLVLIRAC